MYQTYLSFAKKSKIENDKKYKLTKLCVVAVSAEIIQHAIIVPLTHIKCEKLWR